ncbi:MAG: family 1 glycosylhydrolase [Desulfobacterota bacterium]|nr:family 1 glycosylhydrolase [Thermodesulfobacteriota bacterium]
MGERKFLWGVATSAFQIEGSPFADWATWDERLRAHPDVTHHYHLYKEDLKLLKEIGVNAYRFSIEWSRIQPAQDRWDDMALGRYLEIVRILREEQIEPVITLHHFTHPRWFLEKFPWHREESILKFAEYVKHIVEAFGEVRYWITFNEPNVLLLGGYLDGCMPPGVKDQTSYVHANVNLLLAHAEAYDILHGRNAQAEVGLAQNMAVFAPYRSWSPLDRFLARVAHRYYNLSLLEAIRIGRLRLRFPIFKKIEVDLPLRGKLDFIGVNYYTRIHLQFNPFCRMGVALRYEDREGNGLTDMGWEIYPRGLEQVLREASTFGLPVMITENGIATADRRKKDWYIKSHLDILEGCLKKGMDIRGYFYWSLMDHYEWLKGMDARFGLYRVDFETLERKATPVAKFYSFLIKRRSGTFLL